ncbi:hypothetical protein M153_6680004813, partial [Pseudoloma neurophilia]
KIFLPPCSILFIKKYIKIKKFQSPFKRKIIDLVSNQIFFVQ